MGLAGDVPVGEQISHGEANQCVLHGVWHFIDSDFSVEVAEHRNVVWIDSLSMLNWGHCLQRGRSNGENEWITVGVVLDSCEVLALFQVVSNEEVREQGHGSDCATDKCVCLCSFERTEVNAQKPHESQNLLSFQHGQWSDSEVKEKITKM